MSSVNVPVMTVKPGFIHTRMTAEMVLPKWLVALPDEVATDVYRAWEKSKDQVYTKWFWRCIMLIIKSVPERIFKNLNL